MTKPEIALWQILRTRPAGLKFRRQHPVGSVVLDLYHPAGRLAFEVDGIAHDRGENPARDLARDAWLAQHGITVVRIPASDVLRDVEAVVEAIIRRCTMPLHQPAAGPPPHAAHGED